MRIDLLGQRFGRLVVLEPAGVSKNRTQLWLCRCDCGTSTTVNSYSLRSGASRSCGCLKLELFRAQVTKHGQCPKGNWTPLYRSWCSMKNRCLNPRATDFKNYGGRGIGIAPEWLNDFTRFAQDMGEPLFPRATLDRIDNDGDYRPGNVRWATRAEQSRNQRPHRTARPYERGGRTIVPRFYSQKQKAPVPIDGDGRSGLG
jgi:hypothetical protein